MSARASGADSSYKSFLARLSRYCAYQERSHQDVRSKLLELGARGDELEKVMAELITLGFLNEERFAKTFAGGKFRQLKWGRVKIERELEKHGVTARCIRKGLQEIEESEYQKTLKQLISKKWSSLHETNLYRKRDQVGRFVIGKGFEPDLVWTLLRETD